MNKIVPETLLEDCGDKDVDAEAQKVPIVDMDCEAVAVIDAIPLSL